MMGDLKNITPYGKKDITKKQQVSQMFNNISGTYDKLNRLISFGWDVRWRKKVIEQLKPYQPQAILDVATGTGDLALMLSELNPQSIKGLDISEGMLAVGRDKVRQSGKEHLIEMVLADGEQIPFDDATFDAVTVAFGVRNFENLGRGLYEILRVLKKGGVLVVLETAVPAKFPYKQGYHFYTRYLLPMIGGLFAKDKQAYRYLSKSAEHFPCGVAFASILQAIGFDEVKCIPVTFGVAAIYVAPKPF